MSTIIYGRSDDLIEIEGDTSGEVGFYMPSDENGTALAICSDGTVLEIRYGKSGLGIWQITKVLSGLLLDRIEECNDEDADRYSDVAHFREGLKWVHIATEWQRAS